MSNFQPGEQFVIGGQVAAIRPLVTKKGRNPGQSMAQIVVDWNGTEFRIVAFPDVWASVKNLLSIDAPVACQVKKLASGCCLLSVERLDLLWQREGLE